MRARPSSLALACLLAVTVLGLLGCGSDEGSAQETTTATSTPTTTTTTTATESTTASTETESTTTSTETSTSAEQTNATAEDNTSSSSGSGKSSSGKGGGRELDRVSFRTSGNKVVCGLKERRDRQTLICFSPANGATVRLAPRGVPTAGVEKDNRGMSPAARRAPVLARGRTIAVSVYRCSAQKGGAVRCRNTSRHGFVLSDTTVFRF